MPQNKVTSEDILVSHPSEIFSWLDSLLGSQAWLGWDTGTLLRHLPKGLEPLAEDKLLAVCSVAANAPFVCQNSLAFEKAVLAFCNEPCITGVIQECSIEEIVYGCAEITSVIKAVHGKDTEIKFTGEIPGYVAAVAVNNSWVALPKELSFAEELFTHLRATRVSPQTLKEQEKLCKAVRQAAESFTGLNPSAFSDGRAMDSLSAETTINIQVRRILGCYAYDPTVGV